MSDNSKYHDTFSGVADAGFADSTWVALDSVIEEVRKDEREASDALIGLAKSVARADERRRLLDALESEIQRRDEFGFGGLNFPLVYALIDEMREELDRGE